MSLSPELETLRVDDPKQLGEYELLSRLGVGGQSVVYLGRTRSGGLVAVKVLRSGGDIDARKSLDKELAAAQRVAAFCTARLLECGLDGERYYIVTEYIPGPTLLEVVRQGGPRTGTDLHRLAIGTITALAAIHRAGVVHRDFKPGNVLLSPDGPRVIDFGISRAVDTSTSVTSEVIGTPSYMAPEQLAGDTVGPAADIFAWSVTIAFAAAGRPAFGDDSIPVVMNRILHKDPDLGGLPDELSPLVAACLAKDPEDRPTAHDVLLQLLDHAGDQPVEQADVLAEGASVAATLKITNLPPRPLQPTLIHPTLVERAATSSRKWLLLGGAAGVAVLLLGGAVAVRATAGSTPAVSQSTTNTEIAPAVGQGTTPSPTLGPASIATAVMQTISHQKGTIFREAGLRQTARGAFVFSPPGSTNYDMYMHCSGQIVEDHAILVGEYGYSQESGFWTTFDPSPQAVANASGAAGCSQIAAPYARWASSPYNIQLLLDTAPSATSSQANERITLTGQVPTRLLAQGNPVAPLYQLFRTTAPITKFTIDLTADYLPRQLTLTFPGDHTYGTNDTTVTTTYINWGTGTTITAPSVG